MLSYYAEKIKHYDKYTYFHCESVSRIAATLGKAIGLEAGELNKLAQASLLHDLGKIRIPLDILYKPGNLNKKERLVIEKHPQWGIEIITDHQPDDSLHIIQGIISHHEHFDGQGYPLGLAGENIPLFGRIIAVADAFDAMTSFRVYRYAVSFKEACNLIRDGRGSQFDPYLVDKMMQHEDDFITGPFVSNML
jgi:HD-GYP domain-containing protein (c-di-GMP phosphodiesterase class II)